jgi:hypothetical protein
MPISINEKSFLTLCQALSTLFSCQIVLVSPPLGFLGLGVLAVSTCQGVISILYPFHAYALVGAWDGTGTGNEPRTSITLPLDSHYETVCNTSAFTPVFCASKVYNLEPSIRIWKTHQTYKIHTSSMLTHKMIKSFMIFSIFC